MSFYKAVIKIPSAIKGKEKAVPEGDSFSPKIKGMNQPLELLVFHCLWMDKAWFRLLTFW